MRFAVVVLACVLAVAHAQLPNSGQYFPGSDGRYNRYNSQPYNPYKNYNRNQNYNPYKPFGSTPFPRPSVTVTPAPVVVPKVYTPVVTPAAVVPVVVSKVVADARSAQTVKYGNEINPDGSYNYFFETDNGIAAQAQGTPRNLGGNPPVIPDVAQGSFSWYSPEGQLIAVNYVADENGYQPNSDALPKAPEVPAQIARALAYVAARSGPLYKAN